ncbi:DUF3352 domain-containing protein [Desulfopila sp. IMCC35006]|uniref:DUF3352 domain-containing protein n=1 Tax=Desulfopila sp. IMCC35006 TaxID=2569542 RepID=UPI0010ABBC14|nr:DUF3352 domain-containing protein [Desulfopila sp. IMCC35006]TKB27379.1 DUF3352 domain-containing protein [Desulfopila sp. IMCC35006]
MKSNAIAGFLAMVLVVLYPLVNGIQTDSFRDMARFIPDNALLYVEQRNGSRVLKDFIKSPIGKKLDSIDLLQTSKKIGLTEPVRSALTDLLALSAGARNNKLLHEVFGKKFALAFLPTTDRQQSADFTDYIKNNAVFVAKPNHSAETLQFFTESYARYVQTYSISSAQYGRHHIQRLQMHENILSIVIIDGIFVMSANEKLLRRCIDTYDGDVPALGKKADFIKIRKKFVMPERFFYLPIEDVRKYIIRQTTDLAFPGKDILLKELKTTVGFANLGYGSWNKKKKIVGKVLVQYKSSEVNKVVRNHIDAIPVRSSMLSLSTANPMAYYWSNTIEFKYFFDYFAKSRKTDPQLEKFWSVMQDITGKDASEFVALLGEEASIILEPGPKNTFFSFPLGMAFVRVKNAPELKAVLEKITDAFHIPISEATYGPVRYVYWTASPQDGLKPLYGFWGDLLFFGNSSNLLHSIVQRKIDDLSLLDSAAVKAINPGLSEKNNSITFMNNDELITVLQKGLNLVAMTMTLEDRETAFKVRAVIDEIINPLLEGTRMYGKSCTRSYFTPDMVIIDSITTKTTGPVSQRTK